MSASFKKNQMSVIVRDIDELIRHKGEFKQKTDYLFEKVQQISKDVDEKMLKVVSEFNSVKTPLMNKVNDVFEVSKLYHHEIARTQNINREMLLDMSKINQDYEACIEKNASVDYTNSQMGQDPMAMSIFSQQPGHPNSQLQRHTDINMGGSPKKNVIDMNNQTTFLTGVSKHYDSTCGTGESVQNWP